MIERRTAMPALIPLLLLASCRHHATQIVFRDQHVLAVNGNDQTCVVEIRSDPEGPIPFGDPNDETSLRLTCDGWRTPFTRELNSCLVKKVGSQIRWLLREQSVLMELQSVADHGGPPTAYLLFNFETRRLKSDLYGLPSGDQCYGNCIQEVAAKAALYGIARNHGAVE